MYRTVNDFLVDWSHSSKGTVHILESLTDNKLDQAIVEGHNTLGWIGWHIVTSVEFYANLVGLNVDSPGDENAIPKHAVDFINSYKKVDADLKREVENKLTDEKMLEAIEDFGNSPRGVVLRSLIDHQTHHNGQMTVLLRQAGLHVPGVMGHTKEELEEKYQ